MFLVVIYEVVEFLRLINMGCIVLWLKKCWVFFDLFVVGWDEGEFCVFVVGCVVFGCVSFGMCWDSCGWYKGVDYWVWLWCLGCKLEFLIMSWGFFWLVLIVVNLFVLFCVMWFCWSLICFFFVVDYCWCYFLVLCSFF